MDDVLGLGADEGKPEIDGIGFSNDTIDTIKQIRQMLRHGRKGIALLTAG